MEKSLLTRAVIRACLFWLCALPLLAHPFASYLDGAFMSFGLDAGQGDVMESVSNTSINTKAEQIYKAKLSAFDQALADLKNNREQTIKALQNLAQQLINANPASSALNQLIAQINALVQNPGAKDLMANLDSSLSTYQQYLKNTIIDPYKAANQQLINQAQTTLQNYQNAVSQYTKKNKIILTDAINYFNKVNAQIKTTADNLGIPYTLLPLPAPLNKTSVANLTPQQTTIALQALGDEINKIISITSKDIQNIGEANQKIAVNNMQKLTTLTDAKNTAITQALNQITGLTEIVGRAFHNQWVDYASGKTFFLNNAAHASYIDAGDTCVFDIILNNTAGSINSCGYQGGTETDLKNFQKEAKKAGVSMADIWGTLFDFNKIKNIWISPSDCAKGGCSGVSAQQAQQGMQNFFNLMNSYVGAAGFVGNFTNSKLYSSIENDLSSGHFDPVTNFVNAYVNQFVPAMLQTFVDNPVWLMSLVPGASGYNGPPATPSASQKHEVTSKWNSPNVKYCYDSPAIGLDFSQGYAVCGYNWWAQAMFLGYFGYLSNQTGTLINALKTNTICTKEVPMRLPVRK